MKAEVRIAIAQAEAKARDLAQTEEEATAKMSNVFGKAQDRIKSEANKDIIKSEAGGELMSFSEHKSQRKKGDEDDDFISTMNDDKNLMDDEVDKDDIEITPLVEAKPRTKLSFIAPRIPVNRNNKTKV